MSPLGEPLQILMVEDDPAHAEIAIRNLKQSRVLNNVIHLTDGQQALDYLFRTGEYTDDRKYPRPNLILLDLRLPKVDGLSVMREIKNDAGLRPIPVVILTTSAAEADIASAYELQASSYLVKPLDFGKFSELLESFGFYWLAWNTYPH